MTTNPALISAHAIARSPVDWLPVTERPVIGKDVLELLSSSMYASALPIYREYVQNAADAIDEARSQGILGPKDAGHVDITFDHENRVVRVRDNGIGLQRNAFVDRLISFGASRKKGSRARGFRGVGRLAGLGYCQTLVFRSKTAGEADVNELRWDCRKLKAHLRNERMTEELGNLVNDVVTRRTVGARSFPDHFFEVELSGIIRHGNDSLVDETVIADYLSQVAPVPFAPEFRFGREIEETLDSRVNLGNIQIRMNGNAEPIYRPYRNQFEVRRSVRDSLSELQFVRIPGSDGDLAAIAWVVHHSYLGAIPSRLNIQGLRLRSGNMQIGEPHLLDELFPEPRFNAWVVGEVHVIDQRILPNGRRDHFEQNVHFHNVLNQLAPVARDLARRCRTSSIKRNCMRQFEQGMASVRNRASLLRQKAISPARRAEVRDDIKGRLAKLAKTASSSTLDQVLQKKYCAQIKRIESRLKQFLGTKDHHRKLRRFRRSKRQLIQKFFDLLYEFSGNDSSARLLIEKILRRL